jgi:hypothetical protein
VESAEPPVHETYVSVPEFDRPKLSLPPDLPPVERELSGYARGAWLPLDPTWIRWIPAGALFLVFILTFFSWNGLYPAGYPAYTQNAWQGLLGWNSKEAVSDDEMHLAEELNSRVHSSLWLLPYLLLLLPTIAIAAAGPVLALLRIKLPAGFDKVWQFRPAALGLLAIITLMFLLAQWATGFGLQKAIDQMIEEKFESSKAEANTPEKMQRWEMKVSEDKGKYHVKTTPWLRLAFLLHLLAAIAVVGEAGLMLRGKKLPPRIGVMW